LFLRLTWDATNLNWNKITLRNLVGVQIVIRRIRRPGDILQLIQ